LLSRSPDESGKTLLPPAWLPSTRGTPCIPSYLSCKSCRIKARSQGAQVPRRKAYSLYAAAPAQCSPTQKPGYQRRRPDDFDQSPKPRRASSATQGVLPVRRSARTMQPNAEAGLPATSSRRLRSKPEAKARKFRGARRTPCTPQRPRNAAQRRLRAFSEVVLRC
jgi:hypothetical protein